MIQRNAAPAPRRPRLFAVAAGLPRARIRRATLRADATRRNAQAGLIDVINCPVLGVPDSSLSIDGVRRNPAGAASCCRSLVTKRRKARRCERRCAILSGQKPRSSLMTHAGVWRPRRLRRRCVIVGRDGAAWLIDERGADGRSARRAGSLRRLHAARALAHASGVLRARPRRSRIPFNTGSRSSLLSALEVRDVVALLEFFVTPLDDLRARANAAFADFRVQRRGLDCAGAAQRGVVVAANRRAGARRCRIAKAGACRRLLKWLPAADLFPGARPAATGFFTRAKCWHVTAGRVGRRCRRGRGRLPRQVLHSPRRTCIRTY